MCADLDEKRLASIQKLYPQVNAVKDYRKILKSSEIDAVCIATPTNTHYPLSKAALEQGKHVFCEKPLALEEQQCLELEELARKYKRNLMVGHVFLFNQGILRLKEYIRSGELGKVYYAHATRTNLGPFRYDVNALWDLAPHDVSIFNFLFESCPVNVSARGLRCLGTALEDLAFASIEYPKNILINIHVSWLDPKKVRQITIIGDKKMVVWDDLDQIGPIKLYDKHVEKTSRFYETYGEFQLLSKEGSITIPNVIFQEPLKAQAQYFLECIEKKRTPERASARKGYDVVRVLNAIQRSINENGNAVKIG